MSSESTELRDRLAECFRDYAKQALDSHQWEAATAYLRAADIAEAFGLQNPTQKPAQTKLDLGRTHMEVCAVCGNKRCPKAENKWFKCSGSNEIGQTRELEVPLTTKETKR